MRLQVGSIYRGGRTTKKYYLAVDADHLLDRDGRLVSWRRLQFIAEMKNSLARDLEKWWGMPLEEIDTMTRRYFDPRRDLSKMIRI